MAFSDKKLSQALLEKGLLTEEQLGAAAAKQKEKQYGLKEAVIELELLSEIAIINCITKHFGFTYLPLHEYNIDKELISLVPEAKCRLHKLIPISLVGRVLSVATSDPLNIVALIDISVLTNYDVIPVVSKEQDIEKAITRYYNSAAQIEATSKEDAKKLDKKRYETDQVDVSKSAKSVTIDNTPIIMLTNHIIATAISERASDIHIEPKEKVIGVRYRIDGVLIEEENMPKSIQSSLISRFKIMSKMDITERRQPQDGRIKVMFDGRPIDLRVSSLPTAYGEKLVMRILDRSLLKMKLEDLAFEASVLNEFRRCIELPYGLLLVPGPTGSGKTSTLYAALNHLNDPSINVVTVEEPIEFRLNGINQVPVNYDIDFTFAKALRSILRQDPDVVMIGEIRDKETVDIAMKAAMTGHLVLSTLHTNDAPSSLARLTDMGCEPYMIASSLQMVLAQRLMRKLCDDCKQPYPMTPDLLPYFEGIEPKPKELFKAIGCTKCHNTGMRGRTAAIELMPIADSLRELISSGAQFNVLKQKVRELGVRSIRQNAMEKVAQGIVALQEAISETA
ncbi:MAG: ATPase, T2SS/T4P/T4SS family [Planctomycetota bacterium]